MNFGAKRVFIFFGCTIIAMVIIAGIVKVSIVMWPMTTQWLQVFEICLYTGAFIK